MSKLINGFNKIRLSKFNAWANKFMYSPYCVALFGFFALLANIFALEIYFYILVGIFSVYVCVLAKDLLPIMPLFIFCYVSPSAKNNPGISNSSLFYGWEGYVSLAIVLVVCVTFLLRVGLDKGMGYKKLFTQKRALALGFCLLAISYLISGIGSDGYLSVAKNNVVFSLIQFLALFLLYFIFSATVNWKDVKKDYFAWVGVIMGVVVTCELLHIYLVKDIIQNGSIVRSGLVLGWGHYNNIGALIAMSIPFAFYLASTKKHNYLYLILAAFLLCGLILSCSRGSIVCGVVIFLVCFAISFFKNDHKKQFRISTLVFVIVAVIVSLICKDFLIKLFEKVPSIVNSASESGFNDSNRFNIYKEGLKAFKKYPIFGQSFFARDYVPYGYSIVDSFTEFFPPRWHNTIIQILSSCGLVGMAAYMFHRFQTIKLIVKKPSLEKTFIALSILTLLMMSMLDCHFFNIGPTFIYSLALVFAENISASEK